MRMAVFGSLTHITIAENNEDAITDFEIETGYDDFDIISCERSSL